MSFIWLWLFLNKDEDFELSAIINEKHEPAKEKEESIKGDYKSFLHESSNKLNTDMTDMYINKCDFSSLYSQSVNQAIYVLGGFIESSRYIIERFDMQKGLWEDVDELPANRAKFSLVGLSNGSILIMGGKQVF